MLSQSRARIMRLPEDRTVLDVGGWASPLGRADWVIDLMPYESRGLYGEKLDPAEERFAEASWVVRDICDREPWPFEDGQFDFVVCSHTLEDIRDPLWACHEMMRVARGGYVEVPSRLEEQTYGIEGPWVGWGHHRWLIERSGGGLRFAPKVHTVHGRPSATFPRSFWEGLDAEERVVTLWWDGSFEVEERIFLSGEEAAVYLDEVVNRHYERPLPTLRSRARGLARRARNAIRAR